VVRVEPIGGDQTRRLLGSGAGYFPMYNRHKDSICIDLKSDAGLNVARKLAARADILVENFRPGALDRLGLGYDALSAANPRLIYCSEKGFLPGPYEERTALDEVAQMMGGLAYMTGPPGKPLRAGASVIDVTGGMFGVIGILAALEERHRTGRGQMVIASLFETTIYLVGQHMAQYAVTGKAAAPMPARISAWAIYDVFETRDDPIFIGVVTDALWEKFCALFGLDSLWADETIRKNNDRVLARERIMPEIRALIAGFTRAEVIARLDGSGLPFAPIGRPEEMFDDPHLAASNGLEPVTLDNGTMTRLPTIPIMMAGARPAAAASLPQPGAQSRTVLTALGYQQDEIDALIESGAVAEGDA
jgi:crotonobetainyl-CoA:carnitine CoA-transferase CaiB-like acyl-CoA transferase